jgi:hypothetical protein
MTNAPSGMAAKKQQIREAFSLLRDRIGHTSDARRAIGKDYSDYILKEMIAHGDMRKLDFDTCPFRKSYPDVLVM